MNQEPILTEKELQDLLGKPNPPNGFDGETEGQVQQPDPLQEDAERIFQKGIDYFVAAIDIFSSLTPVETNVIKFRIECLSRLCEEQYLGWEGQRFSGGGPFTPKRRWWHSPDEQLPLPKKDTWMAQMMNIHCEHFDKTRRLQLIVAARDTIIALRKTFNL